MLSISPFCFTICAAPPPPAPHPPPRRHPSYLQCIFKTWKNSIFTAQPQPIAASSRGIRGRITRTFETAVIWIQRLTQSISGRSTLLRKIGKGAWYRHILNNRSSIKKRVNALSCLAKRLGLTQLLSVPTFILSLPTSRTQSPRKEGKFALIMIEIRIRYLFKRHCDGCMMRNCFSLHFAREPIVIRSFFTRATGNYSWMFVAIG